MNWESKKALRILQMLAGSKLTCAYRNDFKSEIKSNATGLFLLFEFTWHDGMLTFTHIENIQWLETATITIMKYFHATLSLQCTESRLFPSKQSNTYGIGRTPRLSHTSRRRQHQVRFSFTS